MGNWGARPQHIEDELHRAAARPGAMPLQCEIAGATILVRNRKDEAAKTKKTKRARSFRLKRRMQAGKLLPAPKAVKPKKSAKNDVDTPAKYVTWPIMPPHLMLQAIVASGLIKNLSLDRSAVKLCSILGGFYSTFIWRTHGSRKCVCCLLRAGDVDWADFWSRARSEPWGRTLGV